MIEPRANLMDLLDDFERVFKAAPEKCREFARRVDIEEMDKYSINRKLKRIL